MNIKGKGYHSDSKHPTVTLIITTYNWPEALSLTLNSLLEQSIMPNEVIIADDGSTSKTEQLVTSYKELFSIPILHVWHEDMGFRRTSILNKAVKKSTGEYIIQIDGDIILHPMFIEDHLEFSEPNTFTAGSRAMLIPTVSDQLLKDGYQSLNFLSKGVSHRFNAFRFPLIIPLFSKKMSNIKGLRGCNMAYWKKDFLHINGYNEEIVGWGREDSELASRFINNNIYKRKLKGGGIQFHIYHEEASREMLPINDALLSDAESGQASFCSKGFFDLSNDDEAKQFKLLRNQKISATIITYNEEKHIEKCLESLKGVADEIIVVDSFSTDNTPAICKRHGVSFITNTFEGHKQQKQFAINQASNNFILSLDADEQLSEDLKASIQLEKGKLNFEAYSVNRRNFYCGKMIRHGGWYPDKRIRLFNKHKAHWGGENPHDLVIADNPNATKHLSGDLLHDTLASIAEHDGQTEKYARIAADYKFRNGLNQKNALFKMFVNPLSIFLSTYIFRLGFLDGRYGFKICYGALVYTYRKYKYLRQLYQNAKTE